MFPQKQAAEQSHASVVFIVDPHVSQICDSVDALFFSILVSQQNPHNLRHSSKWLIWLYPNISI